MTRPRDTVLFVSAFPYLGGAQVSLATVLRHLPDDIHAAVAVPERGPFVDRVEGHRPEAEHVVIPELSSDRPMRDRVAIALVLARWVVRTRRRLLAIHVNGDSELTFVVPALALTRRPVFVWHHQGELAPALTNLAPLWRFLRRRITWISVSSSGRDELVRARIANATNSAVVPNPIDPDDVVPAAREQHHEFVAGYLGCEYEAKGFTVLPRIAGALRGTNVRLVCVVKGVDRTVNSPPVNAALDALESLTDVVSFTPRTFDVSTVYARLDAVVVPSRAESFCRVAAEGMTNGLPVVGSDLPAIRELLRDGAGVLVPVDDADAVAEALVRLSQDAGEARDMGDAGRRRARDFAPARITEQLVELYRGGR